MLIKVKFHGTNEAPGHFTINQTYVVLAFFGPDAGANAYMLLIDDNGVAYRANYPITLDGSWTLDSVTEGKIQIFP